MPGHVLIVEATQARDSCKCSGKLLEVNVFFSVQLNCLWTCWHSKIQVDKVIFKNPESFLKMVLNFYSANHLICNLCAEKCTVEWVTVMHLLVVCSLPLPSPSPSIPTEDVGTVDNPPTLGQKNILAQPICRHCQTNHHLCAKVHVYVHNPYWQNLKHM